MMEHFSYYLFLDREGTYAALTTINILSFYSLNFFFLLALTIMVWRIRKIDDDTMIKSECTSIVILWCLFAVIQYGFFIATQLDSCDSSWLTDHNMQQFIYQGTYWLIIARDSLTLFITMAFQIYIAYKESYLCNIIAAEHNSTMSMAI